MVSLKHLIDVKERLEALMSRLLSAKNLKEAQGFAVELHWAIYDFVEQFREEVTSQNRDPFPS